MGESTRYLEGRLHLWLLLLSMLLLLQGCGNPYVEQTQESVTYLQNRLDTLGEKLDGGQLTHALLVKNYADKLERSQPDLRPITQALAKDATTEGNLYQGLVDRLRAVNRAPSNKSEYVEVVGEIQSLDAASDPAIFNDALLDLVNTLADLSAGTLARINIPQPASAEQGAVEGIVPGSYLVGNPHYGSWGQGGSGGGFWAFYGQYRLLGDLLGRFGGNRSGIQYNEWNSRPRHSYYRDYGRGLYGTARDRTTARDFDSKMARQGVQPAKPKRKYGSAAGQQRRSSYATLRNNYTQSVGKKYGASGGPRHAGGSSTRSSNLFSGQSGTKKATSSRSSSLFSGSARSSSRSGRGAGGFGGK